MKDRSSRIGVGCLMLFATPFVAVGLISGVIAIPELSQGSQRENAWLLPIFSLTFLIAGLSVAAMALYAGRALRRQEELRARHPQSPWMWRPEWQSGRITYRGGASALTLWVLAILWNLISSHCFSFFPVSSRRKPEDRDAAGRRKWNALLRPGVRDHFSEEADRGETLSTEARSRQTRRSAQAAIRSEIAGGGGGVGRGR